MKFKQMSIDEIDKAVNLNGEKVKQTELVLMYLEQYGAITTVDAMREFGIMRLASRISDLKRAGFPIKSRMKQSTNRFGRPVHYAEYYVPVEEPKEAVSVGCTVCDENCWGGDVGTARTFFDTGFGGD